MKLSDILKRSNGIPEQRDRLLSISDPALAELFGATPSIAGINVSESSSLGLTAVYRSVSLIAGTIASLPLKTYRTLQDDSREGVSSFLDEPAGPNSLTPMEWKELVTIHLLLHGNAYLLHMYNQAGAIIGLQPIHPFAVSVEMTEGGKLYTVQMADGTNRKYTTFDLTHIMGMSADGITGLSPIQMTRTAIATGIAGDKAAAKMFANGMMTGGFVSMPDLKEEQAEQIKLTFSRLKGTDHAGELAVVNSALQFHPWTMNPADAQFIESRTHQITEVARIFGVPKVLLAEDGASTWGTGIANLIQGWQSFTLLPITTRIEQRLSRLLAKPRYCEFEWGGLLRPTQREKIENIKLEIEAGVLTQDEGRKLLNREPLPQQQGNLDAKPAL